MSWTSGRNMFGFTFQDVAVDIATKPRLCGGIVEVGNAIFQAKDRTKEEK